MTNLGRKPMNVTLWMAMSMNGIVARENQSEDFLSSSDWELFLELVRSSDALIWGRVTHELFERRVRSEFQELPIIVVTRRTTSSRDQAPYAPQRLRMPWRRLRA